MSAGAGYAKWDYMDRARQVRGIAKLFTPEAALPHAMAEIERLHHELRHQEYIAEGWRLMASLMAGAFLFMLGVLVYT